MKILFKLIKTIGIIFLAIILLSIISVVVAKIYEDDLANYAVKELEKEFQAPMSIGEVSIIPLFSFPHISAEINKLYIGDPHSSQNDTLLFINTLKLGLNSWDLIAGKQTIEKLEVSGLDFEYIVDNRGESNLDFLIKKFADSESESIEDPAETALDFNAEKLTFKDIKLVYFDSINLIGSVMKIPEINIKVKSKNDNFEGKTDGSFILSHLFYQDTKLHQMERCSIEFDLIYENDQAEIKQLSINSEGIQLGMEGIIRNSDTIGVNAEFELLTLDFNILKKYLPEEYLKEFEQIEFAKLEPLYLDLIADYKEEAIGIEKLLFHSQGIEIGAKGTFINADTNQIDTDIQTLKLDFAVLKNYIPSHYLEDYGIYDFAGKLDISAKINGPYADSALMPKMNAKINLQNLSIKSKDYPPIDTINLLAEISTEGNTDFSGLLMQFSNGQISTSNSTINFDGSLAGLNNPKYNINSDLDLNLKDFASFIPDSLATNIDGNVLANINTNGILPDEITDEFIDSFLDQTTLSMQLKDVKANIGDTLAIEHFSTNFQYLTQKPSVREIQIDKLNLQSNELNINMKNSSISAIASGKLSDPMQMGVQLNEFNIQNGNIRLYGSGSVNNLSHPDYDISTTIDLQLQELNPFLPDSLVKAMSGFATAKINSKGRIKLDSLETQMMEIIFNNSSFNLSLINAGIAFADSTLDITNITSNISLEDDQLIIPRFSAKYNGVKIEMDSTLVKNIYKAFLLNQKEELYVQTHINVGDVFLNDFAHFMTFAEIETNNTDDVPSSESNSEEAQNWTFLIHGSASVNSIKIDSMPLEYFTINKLDVKDMSMLFKLTDSTYVVDQFKFKAFEGDMNNSIHYKLREDGTQSVSTKNLISNMNLRTLLQDMDNFGQDSLISYKNISGFLSTDLNMFIPIEDSVRIDKMMVSGDLTLEKGGVYDYAPAQEISKFTGIKELDNIQFKTLRSNIFMFKNKLYVPRTDIVSNAIDIAAFGMESLDGDSEYHLEIHLSNILFGKSKKRNKKQSESGDEVDKGSLKKSSRKIRYSVTDGKSKVSLDSKDSRDKMMNKIRTQNKMLDFIFFPKNIHYDTNTD